MDFGVVIIFIGILATNPGWSNYARAQDIDLNL
jgi:hypothetical protein